MNALVTIEPEQLQDAIKRISDSAAESRVRWTRIIAAGGAMVNGAFIEPDEAQVAIGVLDWIGPQLSNALARSKAQTSTVEPPERYRHVKRGTVYEVVGRAELQVNSIALADGATMVVYRGDDGKLWVRSEAEFMDGRFEPADDAGHLRTTAGAHPTPMTTKEATTTRGDAK